MIYYLKTIFSDELIYKTFTSLFGSVLSYLLSFIFVYISARYLGPLIYGDFIFVFSVVNILSIFQNLGLNHGIVLMLSKKNISDIEKRSLLSYSIIVSTLMSILILFFFFSAKELVNNLIFKNLELTRIFFYFLPTIILNGLVEKYSNALRAIRKIKNQVILNIIISISRLLSLVIIVFVFFNTTHFALIFSYYFAYFIGLIFLIIQLIKFGLIGKIISRFDNNSILRISIPLFFSGLVSTLMHNIDSIMIGLFLDTTDLSIYKISLQIAAFSSFILVATNSIFAPLSSMYLSEKNYIKLKSIYKNATIISTIFNFYLFSIILLFGSNLLNFFGDFYSNGYVIMVIISVGFLIDSLVGPAGAINISAGYGKIDFIICLLALIVDFTLNILLINDFGLIGVAIGTTVGILIQNIFHFLFLQYKIGIHPYDKKFISYLLSSVILLSFSKFILDFFYDPQFSLIIILFFSFSILYFFLVSLTLFKNYFYHKS